MIEFSKQAMKEIERLDTDAKKRIRAAIEGLPFGDVKKLKGYAAVFRLRVGNWRIIFDMEADNIRINHVLPRGDAYK